MLSGLNLSIAPSLTGVLLLENRFLAAAAAAVWSVHLGKGGGLEQAGVYVSSVDSCSFERIVTVLVFLVWCIREQCRQLLF